MPAVGRLWPSGDDGDQGGGGGGSGSGSGSGCGSGCGGGGGGDGDEGGGDGGTFWNWFAPGQSFSWTQLILPRFMRLALNDLSCEIFYIFGIFILFKAGSKLSLMLNT